MSDTLYMTPVVGWALFDKSLASIEDNHGNRVSAWSTSCANGHTEGYRQSLDRLWLEQQIKFAAFFDLPGVFIGEVSLGELPSPIAQYCEKRAKQAEPSK